MNISELSNINFQASFIGKDYRKITNMSINNGLSYEDVKQAEAKIHKAFPKATDILEIKAKYNTEDGTTNLDITLLKPQKDWYIPVLERDYTFETKTDNQVKNLFPNLADKIVEMKKIYRKNLRLNIFEDNIKPFSDNN